MTELFFKQGEEFDVFCINFCGKPLNIEECKVNGASMPYNLLLLKQLNDGVLIELAQPPFRSEMFEVPKATGFYEETSDGRLVVGVKNENGEIMSSLSVKIV